MHTLTSPNADRALVDADSLSCPGCGETVTAEPPLLPGLGAWRGAGFSHRDGFELCPDGRGRVCDPIEVRR